SPGDADPRDFARESLDDVHGIARTDPRRSLARNLVRRITEEARQARRSRHPRGLSERVERHHAALVAAHEPLVDVARLRRVLGSPLTITALAPPPVDEIVDVAAAPGGRDGAVDVA